MSTQASYAAYKDALYVDPAGVGAQRDGFLRDLKASGRTAEGKRELYERYVDVIGANGILDGIQELWPSCHSEAHALGYVIEDRVHDVGLGLRICADGCYSGCMHGVLMEAFKGLGDPDDPEGHIDLAQLKDKMNDICYHNADMTGSYSPGDCAHGVGHAVMYLADYDVPKAIGYCREFQNPVMQYYCATGAYMEYVNENDLRDVAAGKPPLYPCTENAFPAACTRYKMVHTVSRHYLAHGNAAELLNLCAAERGANRLACFHGLGNAHMTYIHRGSLQLGDLCLHGNADENKVCIEGAMERMAKYHLDRAKEVCTEVTGDARTWCDQAVANGMYSMTKDMSLYLGGITN